MISISKADSFTRCQCCGKDKRISDVQILNPLRQGVEIHLCKECCIEIGKLLVVSQEKDIKYVSVDDIDK